MSVVYFILILGLIITIHEFGHLVTAKMFGVYCREFAIGMGPKIFSKKGKETVYSLRLLPIGGYVSMAGEEGVDTDDIPANRTLTGISPWKRIIVMLSGIFLNLVLGFILFIVLFLIMGSRVEAPPAAVAGVVAGSPAETAGFQEGDRIKEVILYDGTSIKPNDFYDILEYTNSNTEELTYVIERNGESFAISVMPEYNAEEDRYLVGIQIPPATVIKLDFFECIYYGALEAISSMGAIFAAIGRLVRGIGLNQLSGPVGILSITDEVVTQSTTAIQLVANLINLTALLSINVGIFNLLPLPIFDGGRVLISFVEIIIRRPVNKKLEQILMTVSIVLVLLLFMFIMWQDIGRIF